MRVTKQQAAANRERILEEAARLFRERGIASVGVDALAAAAGMTHGSLYSQFGSKERLAIEAMKHASAGNAARSAGARSLGEFAEGYLSARHRDAAGNGCVLAALGGEVRQHDGPVRETFTAALRRMAARIEALLPPGEARADAALGAVATLVGSLMLARAVDDPALSERLLAAGRRQLAGMDAGDPPAA
jgi:TetR/AcrR family transcriptional repressor of nem operon